MPKQPGNAPESPCGSKDAAEFGRKERHHLNFTGRRTPFQNPATARTAGSCERTGATKAPVLSPAILSTGRFTLNPGGNAFQQSSPTSATRCRQGLQTCLGRHGCHHNSIHPTQRLTRPQGRFSLCALPFGPQAARPVWATTGHGAAIPAFYILLT